MRYLLYFALLILTACGQPRDAPDEQYNEDLAKTEAAVSLWIRESAMYPESYVSGSFENFEGSEPSVEDAESPTSLAYYKVDHVHQVKDRFGDLQTVNMSFVLDQRYEIMAIMDPTKPTLRANANLWIHQFGKRSEYETWLGNQDRAEILPKADSAREAGDYDHAALLYTSILESNDTCASCLLHRGNTFHSLHQHDKAIADYSRLIQLTPTDWRPYANRASSYYRSKQYEKALTDYQKAQSIKPAFDNQICHMLFFTGKPEEACKHYALAMEKGDTVFSPEIPKYCAGKAP